VDDVWARLRSAPTQVTLRLRLPDDHVVGAPWVGTPLSPRDQYFQVRVNSLFLEDRRRWFSVIDPMVLVVTDFTYDKKEHGVPFVVGPSLMRDQANKVPEGMLFLNTRVAGLHPYVGGRLNIAVVLLSVERQNYASDILRVVEKLSTVIPVATAFTMYVNIAGAVVQGVQSMLASGGVKPLIGLRREFDPDAGDALVGGFFALIDAPEGSISADRLWVRDGDLHVGDSLAAATPFRKADFVLYSIVPADRRSDESLLDFYPLYERAKATAMLADPTSWKRAKGDLASLWQTLHLSPDLTRAQAHELAVRYRDEITALHAEAEDLATLGPSDGAGDPELAQAAEILEL
jgi:hypothetical protein